ncbi:MAG: DUF4244 domain-containing protein [Propionibacteriaceae bacterium]|nr:DUF4244 domain-containing protein [Propionibacteriaceae bacterium]
MKKVWKALVAKVTGKVQADQGMATAEYAIGTVAVISFGSLIIKILTDPAMRELIWKLIQWLFDLIVGAIGM